MADFNETFHGNRVLDTLSIGVLNILQKYIRFQEEAYLQLI